MALIHCDFYSEALRLSTSMTVILPQPVLMRGGQAAPVRRRSWRTLYLLHGMSDDHTTWQRRTSIERYVEPLGLAVVIPQVHRSYYADMASGNRYWTFISEEVPALARTLFPLSAARADNFVAGNSMGGYAAFKLALTYPDRFAAAASLSGALHVDHAASRGDPVWQAEIKLIFGQGRRVAGSDVDVFHLAKRLAAADGPKPKLYQWCGQEDYLYEDNVAFRDHAQALGLPLTYEEGPGGHDWLEWDRQIQRVLAWLPRPRRSAPAGAR
jgi:putative tributyrin esterase